MSDRLRDNYSSKAAKYQNDLGTGSASANDIKKSNILILIKKCFFLLFLNENSSLLFVKSTEVS